MKDLIVRYRYIAIFMMIFGALLFKPGFTAEDPEHVRVADYENNYIRFKLGMEGAWSGHSPIAHVFEENQPISGRFEIWRITGNPDTEEDDGTPLIFSHPYAHIDYDGITDGDHYYGQGPSDRNGAWAIEVDTLEGGDEGLPIWAQFARSGNVGILGDEQNGWWYIEPHNPENEHSLRALMYPKADDFLPIRCELDVRLLHDTVRFRWRIKNEDFTSHKIGLKLMTDTTSAKASDGFWNNFFQDYWYPDIDGVVSIPGKRLIDPDPAKENARVILSGKDIPPVLEIFDEAGDPHVSMRYIFDGYGATPPDKVGIDYWGNVCSNIWSYWGSPSLPLWLYEPIPQLDLWDLTVGAFWAPRLVPPGVTMEIICYLGLADATSDFSRPNTERPLYVPTLQGKRALHEIINADGTIRLDPESFDIRAYLQNTDKFTDLSNASFSLVLPPALQLDESETGGLVKTVSRVGAGEEKSVSWKVKTVGNPTGIQTYSVSYSAAPMRATTLSRQINIPSTPSQAMVKGWQMISVPYKITASSGGSGAPPPPGGNAGTFGALGLTSDFIAYKYDSHTKTYVQADIVLPGEGYWLKMRDYPEVTSMVDGYTYDALQWEGISGFEIPLQKGWNLLGNPFVYTLTIGECKFFHPDMGSLSYDEAIERGLISRTVYWYDTTWKRYNWSNSSTAQIKPWTGYWVKALRPDVYLEITPESQIGAEVRYLVGGGDDGGVPTPP